MAQLLCPKCQNLMQQYERNGVHVDQCTECKGLFLDRGELEHLMKAEAAYYGTAPAGPGGYDDAVPPGRPVAAPRPDDRRYDERRPDDRRYEPRYEERRYDDDRRNDDRRYDDRRYDDKHHKKRKKGGFLEDLLDFG